MSKKDPKYYYYNQHIIPPKEVTERWPRRVFLLCYDPKENNPDLKYWLEWIIGMIPFKIPIHLTDFAIICSENKWHPEEWKAPYKREVELPYWARKTPRKNGMTDCPNSYLVDVMTHPTLRPVFKLFRDEEFAYIRTKPIFDNLFEYVPKPIPTTAPPASSNRKESV